jgi:hypothetical protein
MRVIGLEVGIVRRSAVTSIPVLARGALQRIRIVLHSQQYRKLVLWCHEWLLVYDVPVQTY